MRIVSQEGRDFNYDNYDVYPILEKIFFQAPAKTYDEVMIGEYRTPERALQVMAEIREQYKCEKAESYGIVYEMPKE
jgi:hypothetical protein